MDRTNHWQAIYERRAPAEVSWFQAQALSSLELVERAGISRDAPLIDVGSGASTLVDGLCSAGYRDITLLDVAAAAFVETRRRLEGRPEGSVQYVVADVTRWTPPRKYALWHDRAVFHFLTAEADREAYRSVLAAALAPGAHAIVATFALDGPEQCSGLPVRRYSAASLASEFEDLLEPVEDRAALHTTPTGASQSFLFVRFVRR
jgi:trans-aconitate methyltransferase